MPPKKPVRASKSSARSDYEAMLVSVVELLESARRTAARSVNALMTTTYWLIGQRIVEQEQAGARHALYGSALLRQLSSDLTQRFGRGFSVDNLELMRLFYQAYPPAEISETSSRKSPVRAAPRLKAQTLELAAIAKRFPLSWSQYTLLVRRTRSSEARNFYEAEALRGGWTIRQLARQIDTQFYERTLLSRNKAAMLKKGQPAKPEDAVSPEEELKDPLVLEFLGLKDEYSEVELEEALIARLETFLLELGGDFAFVGRQRRLRIGDDWYRVDLLFFHRRLKALVIVDLKLGKLTHADAGQMHLYLNYARQHWTLPDENPPVGLILCADKNEALAHYALEGLPSKVLAAEYRTTLPPEAQLVAELTKTQHLLAERQQRRSHESAATAAAEPATSAS